MTHELTRLQAEKIFKALGFEWKDSFLGATLKPRKRKHTRSQQGKYWACLHEFGEWLGYSKGETETILHNAILCNAFGSEPPKMVFGVLTSLPNRRSSTADRDEYSVLIETLNGVAADHGYTFKEAA